MRKLEGMAAYFFTCLGIVFLGFSILVVPESAFADIDEDCGNACCYSCFGTDECDTQSECYMNCREQCLNCVGQCNSNWYPGCVEDCVAQAKEKCLRSNCESGVSCFIQNGDCDNKNTYCNKLGKEDCGACICTLVVNECRCERKK